MNVYEILKQLGATTKKNDKEVILKENKDNVELKECFRLAYSPTVNFFIKKELTYSSVEDRYTLTELFEHLSRISSREITGNAAIAFVQDSLMLTGDDNCEIVKRILQGDLRCGVGKATINKIWNGLIVTPPRQGAKSCSEENLAKLEKCNKVIELKADGSFLARFGTFMTRSGQPVVIEPLDLHLNCGAFEGFAFEGECIFDEDKASRGDNGIVNKFVKETASYEEKDAAIYLIWDCIEGSCYKPKGKYNKPNVGRREDLERMMEMYTTWCLDQGIYEKVKLIPRTEYVSMEEAQEIFESYVRDGYEGAILKDMDSPWAAVDKPSYCVKMKRQDPADLLVVDIYEGTGKAKGKLGGISLESAEGEIKTNCGSGFDDEQRAYFWNNPNEILGKIVEIEYEQVSQDSKTLQKSVTFPIFQKVRDDKLDADSYEEVKSKVRIQ